MISANELNAQQEQSLHYDVVLEMNIYVIFVLLSRIIKGIKKYAMANFRVTPPKIQFNTSK